MPKRKKCESCNWITYKGRSKKIKEECEDCGDIFPCAGECSHFDCAEHKQVKCHICGKKVKGPEYFLIAAKGVGCYVVHEGCVDEEDIILKVEVK